MSAYKKTYPKNKGDAARFMSWLTDSFYLPVEDEYQLVTKQELKERVKQLFNGDRPSKANELIGVATRAKHMDDKLVQKKVKSFRVSAPVFFNILQQASKIGCKRTDIVRTQIGEILLDNLETLSQREEVNQDKSEVFRDILERWTKTKGNNKSDLEKSKEKIPEQKKAMLDDVSLRKDLKNMVKHILIMSWVSKGIDPSFVNEFLALSDYSFRNYPSFSFTVTENEISGTLYHSDARFVVSCDLLLDDWEDLAKFLMKTKSFVIQPAHDKLSEYGVEIDASPPFNNIKHAKEKLKKLAKDPVEFDIVTFPDVAPYSGQELLDAPELLISLERDHFTLEGVKVEKENKERIGRKIYERFIEVIPEEVSQQLDVQKDEIFDEIDAENFEASFIHSTAYSLKEELKSVSGSLAEFIIQELQSSKVITMSIPKPVDYFWTTMSDDIDFQQLFLKR